MKGFWVGVADLVVKHPLAILSVCLIVIVPLAVVGGRTQSNHSQLADLDPDRDSVVGANVVKRYFDVGEFGPAIALIDNPGLDFRSPRGREAIDDDHRRLLAIDNVADVRSLTSPLGNPSTTGSRPRVARQFSRPSRQPGGRIALCQHQAESRVGSEPHHSHRRRFQSRSLLGREHADS